MPFVLSFFTWCEREGDGPLLLLSMVDRCLEGYASFGSSLFSMILMYCSRMMGFGL
jgi:hypothetical protein